ncbi:UNVERIFIED_CONTAM: hypothetical protein Sradi_4364600 [Sesamum radiatum]|uniref:Nuclear pore complex protein NUP1 n=1 Tax=Sesamum radiatum TaxID=300843 RepID=A0AAW2NQ28_SESRA
MAQSPCIGMSLVQKFVQVPVGVSASPIDIARAYMAGRTSEGGYDLYNFISKGERAQPINEFARKPLLPSPSPKPSICWPGAMVHDRHGYITPQSQRVRHRLHDFPRTPYSRTILSKSSTKLQADSGYPNTSTSFQQSRTSIYGQVNSSDDINDGYGSVGPIRRIRNKFASEVRPKGSIFLSSSKDIPSKTATPKVLRGFLPSTDKNLEPGETSGTSKHWSGDDVSGEHASLKHTDIAAPNFPVELKKSSSNSNILLSIHGKGMDEAKDAVNANAKAWFLFPIVGFYCQIVYLNISLLDNLSLTISSLQNAFATSNRGQTETSFLFSHPHLSNGQEAKTADTAAASELSKNHGTKHSLPSISINKPEFRAIPFDNGPGFTFPVSASSGVLSEPPTPSITPISSASTLSQPIGAPAIPSYSFGTKNSTPRLVFSFPSTSTASTSQGTVSGRQFLWDVGLPKGNGGVQRILGPDGDWPSSAKAEGSLIARPTRRAKTKVGLSDPTVPSGMAVAQQIKVTLGITG